MFVKVTAHGSDGKFTIILNTAWIVTMGQVTYGELLRGDIEMRDGTHYHLTPESFDYLLLCVETQDALATEAPEPPSLKTRIAQALRHEFPNGAPIQALDINFKDRTVTQINSAMDDLIAERVVILNNGLFHHAANFTQTPDPEAATEGLDSAPLADSAR